MPSPMENRAIVFGPSRRPLEKTGSDRVTLSSLDRDFRLPVRPFVDELISGAPWKPSEPPCHRVVCSVVNDKF